MSNASLCAVQDEVREAATGLWPQRSRRPGGRSVHGGHCGNGDQKPPPPPKKKNKKKQNETSRATRFRSGFNKGVVPIIKFRHGSRNYTPTPFSLLGKNGCCRCCCCGRDGMMETSREEKSGKRGMIVLLGGFVLDFSRCAVQER